MMVIRFSSIVSALGVLGGVECSPLSVMFQKYIIDLPFVLMSRLAIHNYN